MNRHATRLRDDAAYLREHTEYKRTADGMEAAAAEIDRLCTVFRANMLRYAPAEGVDAEIDRVLNNRS